MMNEKTRNILYQIGQLQETLALTRDDEDYARFNFAVKATVLDLQDQWIAARAQEVREQFENERRQRHEEERQKQMQNAYGR